MAVVQHVATPARSPEDACPRCKAPKLSDLVVQGPRPSAPQRLPDTADCHVAIYKITDDASQVWADAKYILPLWQLQLKHDARESITVNIYDSFTKFLQQHEDAEFPKSLPELQKQALIKLVVTDARDKDGVGTFRRWRPTFYVAGNEASLHNCLYLLDEFWTFTSKSRADHVMVNLHPHINVDIADCWDKFEYESYTLDEPGKTLPMGVFEAHPVQGKRILSMTMQVETQNVASLVFSGATWEFRQTFDSLHIPGYRDENSGSYYRVMESLDVTQEPAKDKVIDLLENKLSNLAVRVVIEGPVKRGSYLDAFVQTLRARHHMHFV